MEKILDGEGTSASQSIYAPATPIVVGDNQNANASKVPPLSIDLAINGSSVVGTKVIDAEKSRGDKVKFGNPSSAKWSDLVEEEKKSSDPQVVKSNVQGNQVSGQSNSQPKQDNQPKEPQRASYAAVAKGNRDLDQRWKLRYVEPKDPKVILFSKEEWVAGASF